MLDEMFQQNASKFAIFLEYENPHSFFRFSFHAMYFYFFPNDELVAQNEKKTMWVFIFQKYSNF